MDDTPAAVRFADVGHLRLAYETFGDERAPTVLLIHGPGTQMLGWPERLCRAIADAGYRVIRFDNRDIGLSTVLDELGEPSILCFALRAWLGLNPRSPYPLHAMADDTAGLMEALGIERAHIIGTSMGGMIAQHMAARHPRKVMSAVLAMTSSGARGLPLPCKGIPKLMLTSPKASDTEAAKEHMLAYWKAIASPAWPPQPDALEAFVAASTKRRAPGGANETRQFAAILADGSRANVIARIAAPTLVLNGDDDLIVPLACGKDIMKHLPSAPPEVIEGMGHDFPDPLTEHFRNLFVGHFREAEAS